MALINSDWLKSERLAKNILEKGGTGDDITLILQETDERIVLKVIEAQLTEDDIAVDGDGYVTSVVLKLYGRYYALNRIMEAYAGSGYGNSSGDAYAGKIELYEQKYMELEPKITKETITGGDGSEVIPAEGLIKEYSMVF